MKAVSEVTKIIHLTLTEEEAEMLTALVQNPPEASYAGQDISVFCEALFIQLGNALRGRSA